MNPTLNLWPPGRCDAEHAEANEGTSPSNWAHEGRLRRTCGLLSVWLVLVLAGSARAQSIRLAESSADRCLYADALTSLEKAPAQEQASREGLLLKSRLLIQLNRGRGAAAVLRSMSKSDVPKEEADRQLALALALSVTSRSVRARSRP